MLAKTRSAGSRAGWSIADCRDAAHRRADAIDARIVFRHTFADRVYVAGDGRSAGCARKRDGENTGACADIEGVAWATAVMFPAQHALQHVQAASCRAVMAGSESLPGIDLHGNRRMARGMAVVGAVDHETARADGREVL